MGQKKWRRAASVTNITAQVEDSVRHTALRLSFFIGLSVTDKHQCHISCGYPPRFFSLELSKLTGTEPVHQDSVRLTVATSGRRETPRSVSPEDHPGNNAYLANGGGRATDAQSTAWARYRDRRSGLKVTWRKQRGSRSFKISFASND